MWIGFSVQCKLLFLFPSFFLRAQIWFQDTKRLISAIGVHVQEYLQAVITVFTAAMRLLLDSSFQCSFPGGHWLLFSVLMCYCGFRLHQHCRHSQLVQKTHTQRSVFLFAKTHRTPFELTTMSKNIWLFLRNWQNLLTYKSNQVFGFLPSQA